MTSKINHAHFALRFIGRFLMIYMLGSLIYALYLNYFQTQNRVDPFTDLVVDQCAKTFNVFGLSTYIVADHHLSDHQEHEGQYHSIFLRDQYGLSVQEGCNGLNVGILFLAFILALPTKLSIQLVYTAFGLGLIHVLNILRLNGLSYLNTLGQREYFHFYHKYAFTLILYALVLLLWYGYLKQALKLKRL